MTVQHGAVTAAWLNKVQKPFRNAWALCGAAHLHNLKAFDKKVAELCLQHFDQDLGFRSPNMQERLAADRSLVPVRRSPPSPPTLQGERPQRQGQSGG